MSLPVRVPESAFALLVLLVSAPAAAQNRAVRVEWLGPEQETGDRRQGAGDRGQGRALSTLNSQFSTLEPHARSAPLDLQTLQQWALENNPTLEQAQAGIDQAYGRRVQAGLYPNPRIGYTAGEVGDDGTAGQQGALLSQEIVTGGKLRLGRAVAGNEIQRASWLYELQQQRVLNAVKREFYGVLAAEQTRTLTKQVVRLAEEGLEVVEASLADRGTRLDLNRAELEVARAQLLLVRAEQDYEAAWRRLQAVVGDSNLPRQPLQGNLQQGIPSFDWESVEARLAESHPSLEQARWATQRAAAAIQLARSQVIPNVTLQGTTQYNFATNTQLAGVQVTLPLPIYNRNQGNIISAEADYLRAYREADRLALRLQHELAAAFSDYASTRNQVEQYQTVILPNARGSLELSRNLFGAGEINYLELLTAQRTYAQTNQEYLRSLARLWQTIVDIEGMLLTDGLAGQGTPIDPRSTGQ